VQGGGVDKDLCRREGGGGRDEQEKRYGDYPDQQNGNLTKGGEGKGVKHNTVLGGRTNTAVINEGGYRKKARAQWRPCEKRQGGMNEGGEGEKKHGAFSGWTKMRIEPPGKEGKKGYGDTVLQR